MGKIINLNEFLPKKSAPCTEFSLASETDTQSIEAIRDHIEQVLEDITREEDLPLTVAMSAGRFAAMRMFQLRGRAETLAVMDQCITTAELCDDLMRQLDDDG